MPHSSRNNSIIARVISCNSCNFLFWWSELVKSRDLTPLDFFWEGLYRRGISWKKKLSCINEIQPHLWKTYITLYFITLWINKKFIIFNYKPLFFCQNFFLREFWDTLNFLYYSSFLKYIYLKSIVYIYIYIQNIYIIYLLIIIVCYCYCCCCFNFQFSIFKYIIIIKFNYFKTLISVNKQYILKRKNVCICFKVDKIIIIGLCHYIIMC